MALLLGLSLRSFVPLVLHLGFAPRLFFLPGRLFALALQRGIKLGPSLYILGQLWRRRCAECLRLLAAQCAVAAVVGVTVIR